MPNTTQDNDRPETTTPAAAVATPVVAPEVKRVHAPKLRVEDAEQAATLAYMATLFESNLPSSMEGLGRLVRDILGMSLEKFDKGPNKGEFVEPLEPTVVFRICSGITVLRKAITAFAAKHPISGS